MWPLENTGQPHSPPARARGGSHRGLRRIMTPCTNLLISSVRGVYKRILVGVDWSEASLRAARRAAELASRLGAEIRLLTVVPPPTVLLGELLTPEIVDTSPLVEAARRRLDELSRHLAGDYGVEVSYDVMRGEPANTLVEYATSGGYDLLVLGRRGLSGIDRLFLGSVTKKVLERSKVDVLVIT